MLTVERDNKRGGECFAVPTIGEIEGRLLVYETITVACLQEILKHPETHDLSAFRETIAGKISSGCKNLKLCRDDMSATREYALQVFDEATKRAAGK